jgi:hypothetical protein
MNTDGFPDHIEHGQRRTYNYYGCRCGPCTVANRDFVAQQTEQRRSERVEVDGRWVHPRAIHGSVSAYRNWSCRCEACTAAHRAAVAALRARRANTHPESG